MSEFKYTASIIVPVYNVEDYLEICIRSLIDQTMDKDRMEVLLINDGSLDGSLAICERYAAQYDYIKVFSKENEGLSETRNFGIRHAQGKYFFFLDSDDYLQIQTVEKVTRFFDKVYDEVDEVAYGEKHFIGNRVTFEHFRYSAGLEAEGVYDLYEYPYITQTRINVCVKNLGEQNHLFCHDRTFRQEDQEYNNRVLMPKMKIGYCPGGVYMYNRGNESSIVNTYFHAYYMFEASMKYFETLFGYFKDQVPPYFQALYLSDLNNKLGKDFLYPYHYEGEKFAQAKQRIVDLLNRVDVKTIAEHPVISDYFKQYWISLKENASIVPVFQNGRTAIFSEGEMIYRNGKGILLVVVDLGYENGRLLFRGNIGSPAFIHTDPPRLYVIEYDQQEKPSDLLNKKQRRKQEKNGTWTQIDLFESAYSYSRTKYTKITPRYAFEYCCDPDSISAFQFKVCIGTEMVDTFFRFRKQTGLSTDTFAECLRGDIRVSYKTTFMEVHRLNEEEIRGFHASMSEKAGLIELPSNRLRQITDSAPEGIFSGGLVRQIMETLSSTADRRLQLRKEALQLKDRRIWLYYDLYTVRKDNGYYQFMHDLKKQDGIERYYVYDRPYEDIADLFEEDAAGRLVRFGSEEHFRLYLAAELILTGYYGYSTISPFQDETEEMWYDDIRQFKVIYLQHGVLHASLRTQNTAENYRADRIVISSFFEQENYTTNYNYKPSDLICTGMPRYDHIDRSGKAQRKILFAPSWREYFTVKETSSKWNTLRDKVVASSYYKKFAAFLSSPRLLKILEEQDFVLEVKMHPIIAKMNDLFPTVPGRIELASPEVRLEDYSLFITDYSSFVFDFAYLARPIFYFMPDMDQFRSGMGHYKALDLPYEDAFGPMTQEVEGAVDLVEEILAHDCKAQEPYLARMNTFFFDFSKGCSEGIYQYCAEYMAHK